DLRSRRIDLDELIPAPEGEPQGGREAGKAGDEEPAAREAAAGALARLSGAVEVKVDELIVNRTKMRNVHGTLRLDGGTAELEDVAAQAFGGDVTLAGRFDYRDPERPEFAVRSKVRQVRAGELYGYAVTLNRFGRLGQFLDGRLDAEAVMTGELNDSLGLRLDTFQSTGMLEVQEGGLSGHPLQSGLADYLQAPELKTVRITDWLQPFRIENGRLHIDGMRLTAADLELTAGGWQALDGGIGMSIDLFLPPELSAGLRDRVPAELRPVLFDGSGRRILVPLKLSGQLTAPRFSLDTQRLRETAGERAQARLEEERQRAEEEIRDRAGDLIDDFLKSDADTSAAPDSADKKDELKKKAEEEANKLLKGLFQ
ncbi:MAG: hypothetical protein GF355_16025, partial [Candidatus Eisenbacteria bacterium]|nr:hypothetical protein [Candidatus Eisenbacteria bacterium]